VFINGKCTTRSADMPAPGDVISVRGFGRFIYDGVERETKKGRLRVLVRLYPG
jgi:RNA-binding protein YlmH